MVEKETLMLVIDKLEDISNKMVKQGRNMEAMQIDMQSDKLSELLLYIPKIPIKKLQG